MKNTLDRVPELETSAPLPQRILRIDELPKILRHSVSITLFPQVDLTGSDCLDRPHVIPSGSAVTAYYNSVKEKYFFSGSSSSDVSVTVPWNGNELTRQFSTSLGDPIRHTATFVWPYIPSTRKPSKSGSKLEAVGDTEEAIYVAAQELEKRVQDPSGEFLSLSHVRDVCGKFKGRLDRYKKSHDCPPNSLAAEAEEILIGIPGAFLNRRGDTSELKGFVRALAARVEQCEIKTVYALTREENGMFEWLKHLLEMTDPQASAGSRDFAVRVSIVLDDLQSLRDRVRYEENPDNKVTYKDHLAACRQRKEAQASEKWRSSYLKGGVSRAEWDRMSYGQREYLVYGPGGRDLIFPAYSQPEKGVYLHSDPKVLVDPPASLKDKRWGTSTPKGGQFHY